MKNRDSIEHIKEAEESDAWNKKKKKKSAESSIFSTILADIEDNPTILQKQKKILSDEFSIFSTIHSDVDEENPTILQKQKKILSDEFSIFSTILADVNEENPTILQKKKKKLKMTRRRGSMNMTPIDFTCTVSTRADLVDIINQELKILRSETETKDQTSDRIVSSDPNHDGESDCVEEGKVEQREDVNVDEIIEWLLRDETECEFDAEDSVCKVEDGNNVETLDEMLSTMLRDEDEQVNNTERCGRIDEFIEEMLEEVEKDGSYLDRIREGYVFGELIENLIRDRLREKADKEEKEISSWISNGEPEVENGVAEEGKEVKMDIKEEKKMTPMVVKMERCELESTVAKRDCFEYQRILYLIEKLRELDENLMKRRVKAVRYGVELSLLVAEFMFLIPNKLLATETEDYVMCLNLFGVNEDHMGTSVVIGKLQEVSEIVIRKKENKEHSVNLTESIFRYGDFLRLCADAIRALGKIVWALTKNNCERLELSDLDSLFEDCQKVLMKIELKLAEMKQQVYRSVSADYESFSKSERFDSWLGRKLMQRVNADNRFPRSVIGSYLVEIWKSLFQAEALQEEWKEE